MSGHLGFQKENGHAVAEQLAGEGNLLGNVDHVASSRANRGNAFCVQ